MKHTEGKLELDDANPEFVAVLIDGIYHYVATTDITLFTGTERTDEEMEANAAHLVKCWNDHDAMVEALKQVITHHSTYQLYDKLNIRNIKSILAESEEGE